MSNVLDSVNQQHLCDVAFGAFIFVARLKTRTPAASLSSHPAHTQLAEAIPRALARGIERGVQPLVFFGEAFEAVARKYRTKFRLNSSM